eukprot:TRINITY_DN8238_c0_g6_i1.p1 TRINITY_DN8238_c0_g6~~TRINITY_DN8238_c0_g6_i1.p1  ORF type:complete len:706 (+),score=52.21 TRINITY_DN8238_c0_g6_i1:76-2193(+)
MQGLPDSLDERIVVQNLKWIRLRVPLRFEDEDLERSFKLFLRQKTESFWAGVMLMMCFGSLASAISYWEDWKQVVQQNGNRCNLLVGIPSVCMVLINVACYVCTQISPTFFNEDRRLGLIILQVCRFTLCSRPVISYVFDVDVQCAALMNYFPHSTWAVLICMVLTAISCQSACFRCIRSWIMCFCSFSLILAHAFALPQGREAMQEGLKLVVAYMLQAYICFYGQAASELVERRFFLNLHDAQTGIVQERVRRYEAERRAENDQVVPDNAQNDDHASQADNPPASEAASSKIFQVLHAGSASAHVKQTVLNALEILGEDEHWLVKSDDLQLHPTWNLGTGGFCNVVVGTWMGSQVAVKMPKTSDRGVNPLSLEMRHLRKLRHPYIVSFLGICLTDDRAEVLLIEEWVDGYNLETFIPMLGLVAGHSVQIRRRVLLDISAALLYLHCQPSAIVHGDLKPGNVIVDRRSLTAKLTDFGHARRATIDSMPGGSIPWLEPRLRARRPKDGVHCSTDIWAFGCIAFFVCTGVGPWKGKRIRGSASMETLGAEIFELWRGDEDDPLAARANRGPTVSAESAVDVDILSVLCRGCMAVDASQRPTAGDVNREVGTWRSMNNDGALSLSCDSTLSEQVAAVRASSSSSIAPQRLDLRPEMVMPIRDDLRKHIGCLRKVPGLDSHHRAASNALQMLLAAVIEQDGSDRIAMSL